MFHVARITQLLVVCGLAVGSGGCRGTPTQVDKQTSGATPSAGQISVAMESAAPSATPQPLDAGAGADASVGGPRIYSKRRHVWVFYQPDSSTGWAGFLGLGGSVELASNEAKPGNGCPAFYPVKPRGFVCLNDKTTLDPRDPEYLAVKRFAPRLDQPFPHSYGESRGLPRYTTIPTMEQQLRKEYKLAEHLATVEKIRKGELTGDGIPEELRGVDVTLAGKGVPAEWALIPRGIQEERDRLKPLSTVAWSEEFDAEGRTWLITGDLALVPKDKVAPYPRSKFGGIRLTGGVTLPIAFVRERDCKSYEMMGTDVKEHGVLPRLSHIEVSAEPVLLGGKKYWRDKKGGLLVLADDVTVARMPPATPWGQRIPNAPLPDDADEPLSMMHPPKGGRLTWLEVSVLGGWAVAYENTTPVYATMIAPGRGGIPLRGIDPLETASTPTGLFRVDGKFFTSTMANSAFVHSEVPFNQNFHGPHVLHQAYWHDGWGEKKSAGCINLSPQDALWLFHWTEPLIPPGWHGVRSDEQAGPATPVWVHR